MNQTDLWEYFKLDISSFGATEFDRFSGFLSTDRNRTNFPLQFFIILIFSFHVFYRIKMSSKSVKQKAKDAIGSESEYFEINVKHRNVEVFCKACSKPVKFKPKKEANRISDHRDTIKHKINLKKLKTSKQSQQSIVPAVVVNKGPAYELTKALISSDIALSKLDNPLFKNYLEKLNGGPLPGRASCKREVEAIYNETMSKIKAIISENDVYLIMDETTDIEERKIVNVLVGCLDGKPNKAMLVNQEVVIAANAMEIGKVFNKSLNILFPGKDFYEKVKLVITDAAPYMVMCFRQQRESLFPNLIHITCIVHGLHRVAEEIRQNNNEFNNFIAQMKALLLKSPLRQNKFKQATNLNLPPQAIVTRWASWLTVAIYYNANFEIIKKFLETLFAFKHNSNKDSLPLQKLRKLMTNSSKFKLLTKQIYNIEKYRCLPVIITMLESADLKLKEQIAHLDNVLNELESCPLAISKLKKVLLKNSGINELIERRDNNPIFKFKTKYAPLTSVAVERSFSQYKNFLRPNRLSFTEENIKFHSIVNFNKFI